MPCRTIRARRVIGGNETRRKLRAGNGFWKVNPLPVSTARQNWILPRSQHHDHLAAFEFGLRFDLGDLVGFGLHALQKLYAKLLMRHLAPAEAERDLDLVTMFEKAPHVAHLHVIVVGVDVGAHLDFLHIEGLLLLARLGRLFLRLILVFSKVQNLADGRFGVRRDLDKIKTRLVGYLPGRLDRDGAMVLAFIVNELNFWGIDILVCPRSFLRRCYFSPDWSACDVTFSSIANTSPLRDLLALASKSAAIRNSRIPRNELNIESERSWTKSR